MKQIRKRGMNFVSVIDRAVKLAPHCLTRTVHRRPGQRSAINDPLVFTQTDIRNLLLQDLQDSRCYLAERAMLHITSGGLSLLCPC